MKNFPGQRKVKECRFQSGVFRKNDKSLGKVWEFQNFPKKLIAIRLLKSIISIICKQCMVTFLIFIV